MAKPPKNMAASVKARLLNLARNNQRDFKAMLVAFGLERLLYRLSISEYRNNFVLKGGMLVTLWTADPDRITRDVDLLGFGNATEDTLKEMLTEILSLDADDGLVFDATELTATEIREDQTYGGKRFQTTACLETAQIPITIDLGFGDALSDPEFEIEYVSLLDFEPAKLRAYSPATVIAEKFHAIVALGLVNTRMKDFHDLWAIPKSVEIKNSDLAAAIRATFERRQTEVPAIRPEGLSSEFAEDATKITQWTAYSEAANLKDTTLVDITREIWEWLEEPCRMASSS